MPEWSNELKNRATSMSIQWEPMTWPHTWVTWGTCLAQRPDSIYSRSITRKFEHLRNSGRKTIIQLSGSSETCPMKKRLKELTLFSQDVRKWRKSSRRLDGKILRESLDWCPCLRKTILSALGCILLVLRVLTPLRNIKSSLIVIIMSYCNWLVRKFMQFFLLKSVQRQ